jgi:hypothetical protein
LLVDITLVESTATLEEDHRAKHWDASDDDPDCHFSHGQYRTIRSAVCKVE